MLHSNFIAVGFGTMIFVPMLILDNGLNETLKSVLIWVFASVLYGLSFEILQTISKIKYPLHIIVCFIITVATRIIYSYLANDSINFLSMVTITIPIFIAVYIALYLFMKFMDNLKEEKTPLE